MGVAEQASMAIITSIGAAISMIPLGVQEATCGVIGNCIGANRVGLARRFYNLIFRMNALVIITISTVLILTRDAVIDFFTKDEEVKAIVSQVLILLALAYCFQGTQAYL